MRDQRFYFVHSYAVTRWEMVSGGDTLRPPVVSWTEHGQRFVSAVENGPLSAVQFHPEKSASDGLALLGNFVNAVRA